MSEYRVERVKETMHDSDAEQFQRYLNAQSKEGWELVSFYDSYVVLRKERNEDS